MKFYFSEFSKESRKLLFSIHERLQLLLPIISKIEQSDEASHLIETFYAEYNGEAGWLIFIRFQTEATLEFIMEN